MKPELRYAMRSIRHFVVLMTSCIMMHHAQICTYLSPKICPAGFGTIYSFVCLVLDIPPPGWKRHHQDYICRMRDPYKNEPLFAKKK